MNSESIKLWTIKYNNKHGQGRNQIHWNLFEWQIPMLQHEFKDEEGNR